MARQKHRLSKKLTTLLKDNKTKTIGDLTDTFKEKGFAIIFVLVLSVTALPTTTGGFAHAVLLPSSALAALQMMIGRRSLWLPSRLRRVSLKNKLIKITLPVMVRGIRRFEKYSRPRLTKSVTKRTGRFVLGLSALLCTMGAFFAVPFTGLDTLPSAGGVIIGLSILMEDTFTAIGGIIIGAIGIGLIVAAGTTFTTVIEHIFSKF